MRYLIVSLACVLAGCGGGSGGSGIVGNAAVTPVTTYYPSSGLLHETGFYVSGTTTATGAWVKRLDQPGNPKYWEGFYANGSVDNSRAWTEWNADGSIRVDWTDN